MRFARGIAVCVLLTAGGASAQYANRSIGLGVGVFRLFADAEPVTWAVPLTLEGSLYIDDGFDVFLRVPMMLLVDPASGRQILGTGTQIGFRYLFSEDEFRPYAGAELAFLYIFRSDVTPAFFGLGPVVGAEYFVTDSIAIGARGFGDLYLMINAPLRWALGASATVHVYF